jgi:hypothetical protein
MPTAPMRAREIRAVLSLPKVVDDWPRLYLKEQEPTNTMSSLEPGMTCPS